MSRLDENFGSMAFDNLIHGTELEALTGHIDLASGQGTLLRGSVIAMTEAGGDGVLLGSDKSVDASLEVAALTATYEKDGLDITKLKVYAADGVDPATDTTDYTAAYEGGILTITLTADGALKDEASIKIACELIAEAMAKAKYILADDAATGTGDAVVALAYKAGYFNRNKLTTAANYTMTAANEEELRELGIFLADAYKI